MKTDVLYGLVLAGGKSTRMGKDKGAIAYHGAPQWEYLYKLLKNICDKTYLSIRREQKTEFPGDIPIIVDRNEYKGPFNGLLSAHDSYPRAAWLVLACDLPLMDPEALQELLKGRDKSKLATAFATRESGLPEPLASIWESEGMEKSISYLENGTSSCPRKFLINSDIALVFPGNDEVLLNANSYEEYKKVISKLASF